MPRDVRLSDSKCWNGGQKWVNKFSAQIIRSTVNSPFSQLCVSILLCSDNWLFAEPLFAWPLFYVQPVFSSVQPVDPYDSCHPFPFIPNWCRRGKIHNQNPVPNMEYAWQNSLPKLVSPFIHGDNSWRHREFYKKWMRDIRVIIHTFLHLICL